MNGKLSLLALLALATVAGLIQVSLQFRSVDYEAHTRRMRQIQELEQLESRLVREIRFNDAELAPKETLERMQEVVEGLKGDLDPNATRDEVVISEIEEYSQLVRRAARLVAQAQKNRTRYERAVGSLPMQLSKLFEANLEVETRTQLQKSATDFLCSLQLSSIGEEKQREQLDGLVGRLEWFGQQAKGPQRSLFDSASAGVDQILATRTEDERIRAALNALPLRDQSVEIEGHFASLLSKSLERAEQFRLGLFLCAALLAVLVAQTMLRIRRTAQDLRKTKETLEERVKERTRQLVKTNQDLHNEIVERRKAEIGTQQARNLAEAASQTKSEFLANMSHEIRTPMTAILGFSEKLLEKGTSEEERIDAVDTIRRNGEYLLQIINDILDLSKIEAGKLHIEAITSSTVEIAKGVLDLMSIRADEKGLSISVEYVGAVPEFVDTDPVRVRQILLNLVGNAIKFTNTGGILIRIECVEEPYEMRDREGNEFTGVKPFLKFSVIDTGIGMTEEQLATLFRPFTQADNSTTRNFGGTGLGLSISKSLCNLLGGRIEVSSSPGHGSRFTFTIDTGRLQGVRLIEPHMEHLVPANLPVRKRESRVDSDCSVLLAEDGVDNQRLLRYLLERAGADVTIVSNGQQALNHAMAGWVDGDPYDVILMDMQMPVMDGYTAVRELRAAGYSHPIVALTAHAMATDRERCLEIGCDDFCAKPVDSRELINVINQQTTRARQSLSVPSSAPELDPTDSFSGDPEMDRLIQLFVDDLQADVVAFKSAVERGDLEKIAVLAHQLKGCAGGYGFPEISDQAAVVERLAKEGEASTDLEDSLELLYSSCKSLKG